MAILARTIGAAHSTAVVSFIPLIAACSEQPSFPATSVPSMTCSPPWAQTNEGLKTRRARRVPTWQLTLLPAPAPDPQLVVP
jgi:hypothetical protein